MEIEFSHGIDNRKYVFYDGRTSETINKTYDIIWMLVKDKNEVFGKEECR